MTTLEIHPLTGALGAEIRGVRLPDLSDADFEAVRAAWLEHLVVFFPDQHLTAEEHIAFGERFGFIEIHPFIKKRDGYEKIVVIDSTDGVADVWHTDCTYQVVPPLTSILHMMALPPVGGDTMWLNQYLAYERLSPSVRDLVDGLTAVHTAAPFGKPEIGAEHPAVITHPETGRKALFVNRQFVDHFVGMSRLESDAVKNMLCSFAEQPIFQMRYRWREGTVGMWDNRVTQHYAVADYNGFRSIQRVTVLGEQLDQRSRLLPVA